MSIPDIRLTVVYDNYSCRDDLRTAHGFACLVDGLPKTILFDTGGDGEILLNNLEHLGRTPQELDIVFISHAHWDHSGGLFTLLHQNPDLTVYVPVAVSKIFRDHVEMLGARAVAVDEAREITAGAYSTGQLGGEELERQMREQAIILDCGRTIAVLTGCAHPGIAAIAARAGEIHGKPISLLLGGFHLMDDEPAVVDRVIGDLRDLGVQKVGTSHCTGEEQIDHIRRSWGSDFVEFNAGTTVWPTT
jgi:7,8-dihydropterin-6-yl-methyl-4-(beta-D-ribofuranosyl)aminobenzene 5'-phosphate synthase